MIGRHEAAQRFRIDPPVAVCHSFQRNVVNTGVSGRPPASQARQFAAVALGQVPLGGTDLFLDQVKVVEQPFPGRGNPALIGGYGRQLATDIDQGIFVGRQPSKQAIGKTACSEAVCCSQRLAVLRHLIGAIQGCPQRRLLAALCGQPLGLAPPLAQPAKILQERLAEFQIEWPFQKQKNLTRRGAS